ncbi:MAG: hypothetical protein JXB32_23450, partial [Deltaproteobacteria bacterium]|nr:hypothetical protein [Deltaproteobacteria bacterium]
PRTLSPEHWRRLEDGRLLARQPRVNWADLLRRTWAEDVLVCPSCAGRPFDPSAPGGRPGAQGKLAVLEPVTDPTDIREHLERLGRAAEPAVFAPPHDPDDLPVSRASRPTGPGPPSAGRPPDDGSPPSSDDFADPPWQEDCQLPPEGPERSRRLYDDTSQVPPQALSEVEGPDARD